ncbi:hypothetical protein ABW21_db0207107 [Orbilia brochopaga]|nr:hypothetical protein ABW21_db0207107 [Drechslerella brochopaga]
MADLPRYEVPFDLRSNTGTQRSGGFGDIEFPHAGIWYPPGKGPNDVKPRNGSSKSGGATPVELPKIEVDTWIRGLYLEDQAVREAVETGIRTTGLTAGFQAISGRPSGYQSAPEFSISQQQKSGNGSLYPTWGEASRRNVLQQRLVNKQQTRPQRPPPGRAPSGPGRFPPGPGKYTSGPGKFPPGPGKAHGKATFGPGKYKGQRGPQKSQPPKKPLEGPANDLRKLNEGDILARQNDREPTGVDRHHINAIADVTGTHMKFPQDEPQDWTETHGMRFNRIRIWGSFEAVERAKEFLIYLNKHADKSAQSVAKKTLNWAKVKAIPDKRHREAATKEEKEREAKSRFRSFPDPNEVFPYTGVFAWPHTEVSPSEVLGMNYESLDPIRLEVGVYIVYSSKRHCFRVLGYDQESIQEALDRVYVVFCEVAARNRAAIALTLAIPPKVFQPQVMFNKDHELSNLPVSFKPEADSVGVQIYLGDDGSCQNHKNWASRRDVLTLANESFMKSALDNTLKDMFYLRMFAKLRIYFGTFVLFGYRRPRFLRHGLEEFSEMLRVAMARGEIFRQVGERAVGERLLNFCEMRTDLFHPASPYEHKDADGNMEPVYSSSMYLIVTRRPDPPVEIKLEVEFEKSPTGEYRVSARRWLRLPRTTEETTRVMKKRTPLDLKLIDLEANVAYEIEMTIGQALHDLDKTPVLSEFVLHLNLVDSKDNTKRVSYITLPGIKVVSIVTKKKYPYWFTGTPYIFEVTQYEHIRDMEDVIAKKNTLDGGFPADFSDTTTDIRWGVSLYNSEWDHIFTKQSELPIGRIGNWTPNVDTFFATTGGKDDPQHNHKGKGKAKDGSDGFRNLMDRIEICIKIIAEIKAKVKAENRAKEGLKPETSMQQLIAADDATRNVLQNTSSLIDTVVQDDRFEFADAELSTGGGDEEEEPESDSTAEEDDLYARPPVLQPQLAKRTVRKSVAKTVTTQDMSMYGDTEFSYQIKAKMGLDESDTDSRYGESEYSRYARPGKLKYGLHSDTASRYGDSEYSRAEKEKSGLM